MRLSFLIVLLIVINWNLSAQSLSPWAVHATIDKTEVTTGDFVLYQIEVVHPTEIRLKKVTLPDLPQWVDVEPLEPKASLGQRGDEFSVFKKFWPFDDTDSPVKTTKFSWLLWPTQEGEFSIPEILVISQDIQQDDRTPLYQGKTNPITVTVQNYLNMTNPNQPPVLKIEKKLPPPPISIPWLWMIVGVAVLVGFGIFLWIYKKRKKTIVIEPQETPHARAMRRLQELEQFLLNHPTQVHDYYYQLSEIFREYLEKRFDFSAVSMTSQEFLPLLENKTPYTAEERNKIVLLTQKSDLIKYAEALPTKMELESAYNEVVSLIETVSYSISNIEDGEAMQSSVAKEVS